MAYHNFELAANVKDKTIMQLTNRFFLISLPLMGLVIFGASVTVEKHTEKTLLEHRKTELNARAATALQAAQPAAGETSTLTTLQALASNIAQLTDSRVTYLDGMNNILAYASPDNKQSHLSIKTATNQPPLTKRRAPYTPSIKADTLTASASSTNPVYTQFKPPLNLPLTVTISTPLETISRYLSLLQQSLLAMALAFLFILGFLCLLFLYLLTQQKRSQGGRSKEQETLQSFDSLLNACPSLREAGDVMSNIIPNLLPGYTGSVSIINESQNRLELISQWGNQWPGIHKFSTNDCWALRKGNQHLSLQHNIQSLCNHWVTSPTEQTLCIPLIAQGKTIGILHFITDNDSQLQQYRHIWSTIASQVGLIISNLQLRDNLREQAIRDPLTNLFNRRYMMEALDQAHCRAQRTNKPIAILMIDLDHFKRINDSYGHGTGDEVLKSVSKILTSCLRQEDIACRYGGEEFCIVCPFTDQQHALLVAERICDGIRSIDVNTSERTIGTITTSIGLAIYPDNGDAIEEVINAADEALYLAKQNGRDRIEVAKATGIKKHTAEDYSPVLTGAAEEPIATADSNVLDIEKNTFVSKNP